MYFVDYNKLDPQNLSVLAEIPNGVHSPTLPP